MPILENTIPMEIISPNVIEITERLRKAIPELSRKDSLSHALNLNGASIEHCAKVIAETLQFSSDEKLRFNAAESALKMHGAFESDGAKDATINFIFQSDNVQIANILNPVRE